MFRSKKEYIKTISVFSESTVGLVDSNGTKMVSYSYDAWGKMISKTGSLASTLGTIQPFRYRGYKYDEETDLYYLNCRFYRPGLGRFIHGDVVLAGQNNVYAYCENEPVGHDDQNGQLLWECLLGAAVGVIGQYVSDVVENVAQGKTGWDILKPDDDWEDYVIAAAEGAVTAIPGLGAGAKAFIEIVVEPCVSTGADYLLSRDDFDENNWGAALVGDIAGNAVDYFLFDAFTSDMPDTPKYIRDIKREASSLGIKGTKKLNKFLKKKYRSSLLTDAGVSIYTNLRLKHSTEHSGFFVLAKLSAARRTGCTRERNEAKPGRKRHCANDMV